MRRSVIVFVGVILLLLITGCNSESSKENTTDNDTAPESTEKEKTPEENNEEIDEQAEKGEENLNEAEEIIDNQPAEEEVDESNEEDVENTYEQGDYNVYIGGEMVEADDKIIINGKSNLIPKSRVIGEVRVGDEEEEEFLADTSELVEDDGSFYMEIDHHNLSKETDVTIKFHFDGQQDDQVIRHYGDRGQNLEGPFIFQHKGELGDGSPQNIFKQAMATVTFEPSKEKAVRQFKEPNWYPIPDDMGDPRVWIDVEEINNDEEFFYIHSRSNLIEGSNVFANYGSRVAESRVLPDGSFNLKFPYEYKEDTPFEIEFDPSHYSQWNIVEETYGAIGQKLVGDLVVQDKYSDKQFVQEIIEQESAEIEVPDNVELTIDGSEITMLVPDDVLFDFDKYKLKDSSKKVLKEIANTLDTSFNTKNLDIIINGHTDSVGDKDYNLELSEKRAEEVQKYLEKQMKNAEATFTTEGYGDKNPVASNDTEKGQAKNRRVEIIIHLQ